MCMKKDGGPREKRGVEVFITETSCQHAKKRGRQIARYPNRVQGCRQYTNQHLVRSGDLRGICMFYLHRRC
jgi:hypothetical protein